LKFLVDAQLPDTLIDWLQARGCEAIHVAALHMRGASDEEIWAAALRLEATIVTKDRDFVAWALNRKPCARVVWLRFGNTRNWSLLVKLDAAWPAILEGLAGDVSVVEVGRR
jgi:predicted nuclease of predicted toxin-antitoxin system